MCYREYNNPTKKTSNINWWAVLCIIAFVILLLAITMELVSAAQVEQFIKCKATWKLNPPEDSVTGYELFMSETSNSYDFTAPIATTDGDTFEAEFTVPTGTVYYFVLLAKKTVNNKDFYSQPSNELTYDATCPTQPVLNNIEVISITFEVH